MNAQKQVKQNIAVFASATLAVLLVAPTLMIINYWVAGISMALGLSTAFGAIIMGVVAGRFFSQVGDPIGFVPAVAGGVALGGAIAYFAYGIGSGYGDASNSVTLGALTVLGAIAMAPLVERFVAQEGMAIGARFRGRIGLPGLVAGAVGGAIVGGAIGYFAYGIGSGYGDASNSVILGKLTAVGAILMAQLGGRFVTQEGAAIGARFRGRIGLPGGLVVLVAGVAGGAIVGGAIVYFAYGIGSGYGDASNSVALGEFTAYGAILMGMFGGFFAIGEGAAIGTRLRKRIGLLGGLIALVAGVAGGAALGGAIGYLACGVG